ncbi:MAG: peptidylprolyl isomerase [Clostridia bacterium]|nr:peptidylprolyl isomerase [Clostridia bacterium]
MKRRLLALLLVCMALLLSACGVVYVNPYADIPKPVAVFTLDIDGQSYVMRFTLDPGYAPNTVSNFINLANAGFYDGLKIDYVYPTYFIRGGDPNGDGTGGTDYTIRGEFKANGFEFDGMPHERGVISMCRLENDYNSAGSQFFIMLSRHSEYDDLYAAFGRIEPADVESMNTLSEIEQRTTDNEYRPILRQTIVSVRVDTRGYEYTVIKNE